MSESKLSRWQFGIAWMKKHKKLLGAGVMLFFGLLAVVWLDNYFNTPGAPVVTSSSGQGPTAKASQVHYNDQAMGDDTAESLNALTEQIHEVITSNQNLQNQNAALMQKNAKILETIRQEVEASINAELKKRGDDNTAKIQALQNALAQVNDQIATIKTKAQAAAQAGGVMVGGQNQNGASSFVNLAGEPMVAIPDIAGQGANALPAVNAIGTNQAATGAGNLNFDTDHASANAAAKPKPVPFYTIPDGATLTHAVTMTALIGRVPVNGVVKSPYPFKMILGGENLAANGLHIPGLAGAIVQGVTVGDMALQCVKGYVTSITFIFPNGSISTTSISDSSGDLGFSNSLGYLSQPNGNPCFPGKFYTNAPRYLATMVALGALNEGGQAYSQAQETSMSNAMGGTTSALTGSIGKYMLGGAVSGGTEQAMQWYTERERNSFDAVYVPAGQQAVINITREIPINYEPQGRKITYGAKDSEKVHDNTSLD